MKPIITVARQADPFGAKLLTAAINYLPDHWLDLMPKTIIRVVPLSQASKSMQSSPHAARNRFWDIRTKSHAVYGFQRYMFYAAEAATGADAPNVAMDIAPKLWDRLLSRRYSADTISKVILRHAATHPKNCPAPSMAFEKIKHLVLGLEDRAETEPGFAEFFKDLDAEFRILTAVDEQTP